MTARSGLANVLWTGANLRGSHCYRSALRHPQRVQEAILAGYLRNNRNTAFGRRHRFAQIGSIRDFQARVPLTDYDDYEPYIDRIAAGEAGCLTCEPVERFALSSGSTRAAKWIPYTRSLREEFRRAVAPWIIDLVRGRPSLLGGKAYWSISPAIHHRPDRASIVPVGFDEDSRMLGGIHRWLVDATLAVPGNVSQISEIDRFRRITLLFLLRASDLRLMSVWHPSFLRFLVRGITEQWDGLVSDIRRGLCLADSTVQIPPDPSRARFLAGLDPTSFTNIWPRLTLISCWGDSHAANCLAEVGELFPGVEIQSKGLIATEAFASLPYRGRHPLAVTSHFFEFLDEAGRAFTAWELEPGGEYTLAVTTGGGLYRYKLRDRVAVTGFLEATPCLRFLGKEDRISDLCGEKLSEGFVAAAIRRTLARCGIEVRFSILAPESVANVSRYVLFLETPSEPPPELAGSLDAALRENPHYDYCIRTGQLESAEVVRVGDNAFERYAERLGSRNQRLGAIKPSPLSSLPDWRQWLESNEGVLIGNSR